MKFSSLIIIGIINIFFSYKYLERITDQPIMIAVFLGIITFLAPYFLLRWDIKKLQRPAIWVGILLLFSILYAYYFYWLDPTELNVDRWSVVTSFWDAYFTGEYPFKALSHMGNMPGPLPFFFVICLPFYLLGNLGWATLSSIWLFCGYLYFNRCNTSQLASAFFLLFISAPILWELAVLSNLFFNAVFVIFYMHYLTKRSLSTWKEIILWGLLTGFLICTRAIFVIPISLAVVLYYQKFKPSIKLVLSFTTFTLLGIIISFIPFVIGNWGDFWDYNPFVLQSTHFMPFWLSLSFIFLAIIVGFFIRRKSLMYSSGILILATIISYFTYAILTFGWKEAYFESKMDISYLIMALPFFIISATLSKEKLTSPLYTRVNNMHL